MSIVYVAGKYRSRHWWGKLLNIWRAREAGKELVKQGYSVIVPHMNTAFMDAHQPDKFWLDASIEILSRLNPETDMLYMLKGWMTSEGSWMEWHKAKDMGLKIVYER